MVITTRKGQKIIIDSADYPLVSKYTWYINAQGYAITSIYEGPGYQKIVKLHHIIIGQPLKGLVTDHINRNKLDNRRSNLRICSYSQNSLNKSWKFTRNPYGTGVSKIKGAIKNPYRVQLYINGKKTYVGYFKTAEEASNAYIEAKNMTQISLLTNIRVM